MYEMIVGRVSDHLSVCMPLSVCEVASVTHTQPPFDGDTDDELFDNILRKQVHLPRSLGEDSKSIICGVGGACGR